MITVLTVLVSAVIGWCIGGFIGRKLAKWDVPWKWFPAYRPGTTLQVRWVVDEGPLTPFMVEYVSRRVLNYHHVKVVYDPREQFPVGEIIPVRTKELFQP